MAEGYPSPAGDGGTFMHQRRQAVIRARYSDSRIRPDSRIRADSEIWSDQLGRVDGGGDSWLGGTLSHRRQTRRNW
jgi:hypothetical protein